MPACGSKCSVSPWCARSLGSPPGRLELPAGATAETAAAALAALHPGLLPLLPRVRFAVNEEFSPGATTLREGDRLALIPPVSGG